MDLPGTHPSVSMLLCPLNPGHSQLSTPKASKTSLQDTTPTMVPTQRSRPHCTFNVTGLPSPSGTTGYLGQRVGCGRVGGLGLTSWRATLRDESSQGQCEPQRNARDAPCLLTWWCPGEEVRASGIFAPVTERTRTEFASLSCTLLAKVCVFPSLSPTLLGVCVWGGRWSNVTYLGVCSKAASGSPLCSPDSRGPAVPSHLAAQTGRCRPQGPAHRWKAPQPTCSLL